MANRRLSKTKKSHTRKVRTKTGGYKTVSVKASSGKIRYKR